MIRTGIPAELRRWPLRVPTGLRQTRQRHSYPKSLDIPLDIPVESLVVPKHARLPKFGKKRRATPPPVVFSTVQPSGSRPIQQTPRPCRQLSLYPKLYSLLAEVGRKEHSFESILQAFNEHIDELVASRPVVIEAGNTEQRIFGSVADLKSLQRSLTSESVSTSGDSQEARSIPRGRRSLFSKEFNRIDFCLQAILRHPHGLSAGKAIFDRLLEEGIVPGQESMTMLLKGKISQLKTQSETSGSHDLSSAQRLCRTLLERVPYADSHLFNLIASLQIVSGTPSIEVVKLVGDHMTLEGKMSTATWIPQAFDLIMRAYRRDGDIKGVMRWFSLYTESRACQKRQQETLESTSGPIAPPQADLRARIWPYITMLHANADARSSRRALRKGAYVPGLDHASSIVRQIVRDDLHVPSEVYGYLIGRAIVGRDFKLARSLGDTARERSRESGVELSPLVWTYCFQSLSQSKAEPGDVRHLVQEMLQRSVLGSPHREPSVQVRRKLYTLIAQAALSGGRQDFTLALWATEECMRHGIAMDTRMMDTIVRAVLNVSLDQTRNKAWIEAVLGGDAVDALCASHRSPSRYRTPFLVRQRGIKLLHWNVVSWRLYRLSVELAESQTSAAMDRMIYLPLGRPLARLQESPDPVDMRRPWSIRAQLYDYRWWRQTTGIEGIRSNALALESALRELLRRGISAQRMLPSRDGCEMADVTTEMDDLVNTLTTRSD